MKKILKIVVISIIVCNVSYSKINQSLYKELYDFCMVGTARYDHLFENKTDLYRKTSKYCKCVSDFFDQNYDDNSINKFFGKNSESTYHSMFRAVSIRCQKESGILN